MYFLPTNMMWSCFAKRLNILNAGNRRYWYTVARGRHITFWTGYEGDNRISCRSVSTNVRRIFSCGSKESLHNLPPHSFSTKPFCPLAFQVRLVKSASKALRKTRHRLAPASSAVAAENKKLSVAAEMLIKSLGLEPDVDESGSEKLERQRIDASFAELEELAATKITQVYPVIEDLSDDEMSDRDESSDNERLPKLLTSATGDRGTKRVEIYGTPDPTVPMSRVPCHGCGAMLHCQDPGIPGYVPSQKFVATPESQRKDIICQRCHLMEAFNIAVDVSVDLSDYEAVINEIRHKTALLLLMIDLTDLPNSFPMAVASLIGPRRPLYVIGNKVDLMSKDDDGYLKRIKESVLKLCEDRGVSRKDVKHLALLSAKTGYGIEDLITKLMQDWSRKGQVYLLGCTNAGKSTLFNALLSSDFCRSSARDIVQRATASQWPGTTLNLLKFPIVNPKPALLHKRIERLQLEQSNVGEELKLRRNALRSSGHSEHATLMGHIGTSFLTPQQLAYEDELKNYSGFVVPSYTFSNSGQLKQHSGEDGIIETLKSKVQTPSYDDSKFKYWCYDTPGLINPEQIINLLNQEELSVMLPRKLLKPRTYVLKPNQVMFVSGLGRIDYSQGDVSVYFTVFASDMIHVHVLNKDKAEDFYNSKLGTDVFGIPLGDSDRLSKITPMAGKEFTVKGIGWKESTADIVLSSLGWVAITAGEGKCVTLTAFTPGGKGCALRTPSLLKYAVNLRGKRIQGTAAYRTRRSKMCDT